MNKEIKEFYQKYVDATKAFKDAQLESEEIRKSIPAIENGSDLIMADIKVQREARRIAVANRQGDEAVGKIDSKIRELTLDLEKQKDVIFGIKQRYDHFLKKGIPGAILEMDRAGRKCYEAVMDDLLTQIPEGFKAIVLQASYVASSHGLSYGGHSKFLQDIFPQPTLGEMGEIQKKLSKIYGVDV